MGTIGVLIGLREPLLQEGFVRTLENSDDCQVVAVVATADEVLSALPDVRPDVAVVDVRFQREDPGFLLNLRDTRRETAILIYVDHEERHCILRRPPEETNGWALADDALAEASECCLLALRHKALGCIPREATPARVVSAVRTVAQGDLAAEEWAIARWQRAPRVAGKNGPRARITARELEVIRLVAAGQSNREIAEAMDLREQTVKNHLARIMKKLGATNRVDVAVLALEHHLTD